jgi:uncharacterized protein involved in response to NO
LLRVAAPLLPSRACLSMMEVAGALWALGFALFVVRYAPILLHPRLDGRPG